MWLLTKLARRQYIQISSYTLLPVTPIQADEWISARFRVKSPFQIAEDSYSRVCLFPLCTIPDNKGTNETLKWHHTLLRLEQLTFPKLAWCTRYLDLSGPDSIIHNFLPLLYSSDLLYIKASKSNMSVAGERMTKFSKSKKKHNSSNNL